MANLRTNNLSGQGGRNAIKGSVVFGSDETPAGLRIEDNSELELGSETHWTIEFWIFLNGSAHGDYDVVLGKGSGTGNNYEYYIEIMSDNTLDFLTTTAGTAWDFQQQITPVLQHDSWHHIALVRNGSGSNSLKSYVNGQEYGSFTAQNIHTSSYPFGIGYYAGLHAGLSLAGNATLSNLRICKGHAVYTANFEPPRYELKSHYIDGDDKTVLLCCQDSDNPLQEATGKTITGFGRYEYLNDTEVVLNGTFDTDTSNWTTQGDTVEINNERLKIIRTGTFGAATQQLNARLTQYTQYKLRGRIEQSGSPGSALIRLSQYANGNGTIFFNGAYGTGVHEHVFTTDTSPTNFYVSAICGNGNVTGIFDDISVKAHNIGSPPKNIPPCGSDAGNTFNGAISMNSPNYMYFPTGNTEQRVTVNNNFGARGLVMGGITYPGAGYVNTIEFIQIATLGNSVDFGDLTNKPNGGAGFSSKIRGFVAGGNTPEGFGINVIQFVTIATTGNATDFGDVGYSRSNGAGVSNNTRGVYAGGETATSPNPSINNIEFVTMSTTGDGQDFGDLIDAASTMHSASSPTRGLYLGGYRDGDVNFIDFLTISTTGNTQDFGDLVNTARNGNGGVSNGHRGIVMGGYSAPARTNVIQYVTIQSTGNAIDFGDLTDARDPGVFSSLTRGVACSGDYPSNVNIIDFIEIMTTANAVDFGDMLTKTSSPQTCSNAHGGLADDM